MRAAGTESVQTGTKSERMMILLVSLPCFDTFYSYCCCTAFPQSILPFLSSADFCSFLLLTPSFACFTLDSLVTPYFSPPSLSPSTAHLQQHPLLRAARLRAVVSHKCRLTRAHTRAVRVNIRICLHLHPITISGTHINSAESANHHD